MPKSKKPPKDQRTPMYKVWARDVEDHESAAEYGALDVTCAAEIHARYGHSSRDYWECSWPMVFIVIDPHGKGFAVEVEREMVPEFRASPPASFADFAPAIHVTEGEHGPPMCTDIRLPSRVLDWPAGQRAIPYEHVDLAWLGEGACAKCLKRWRARVKFMADVAVRREQIEKERQP